MPTIFPSRDAGQITFNTGRCCICRLLHCIYRWARVVSGLLDLWPLRSRRHTRIWCQPELCHGALSVLCSQQCAAGLRCCTDGSYALEMNDETGL